MFIGKREEFDLNEMAIFVRVVESGSFTGAAKTLGLPKSTVSRKITQLEERLGVRLIQRTTRSLSLTDTGSSYYEQCERILSDIENANRAVTEMQSIPSGTLRITAAVIFGSTVLPPLIAKYMELHPQVNLELILSDQVLDLVQEGIDVAFRIGDLEDSSLIGRDLGHASSIICASPEYLERYGKPTHPDQLSEHQIISTVGWTQWNLKNPDNKEVSINVKPRLKVNDISSLYTLALAGVGIAPLPLIIAASAVKNGTLIPVMCNWPFETHSIHALYASNRHLSAKVRSFVDFVIENVRPNPPWQINMEGFDRCEEAIAAPTD